MLRPLLVFACLVVVQNIQADDWRRWRGPTLDNHAPAQAADAIPIQWSANQNIAWRQNIPGQGHATPIVVNDAIFVLTHEPDQQSISLLKYKRSDGQKLGQVVLHRNVVPPSYLHKKNTCASGTPSSDGQHVFVVAQVNDAIVATAVSTSGDIVWQKTVAPYQAGRGWFGYGASLLLMDDCIVVPVDTDNDDRGLYCLDKATGALRWRGKRPSTASYSSPILANVAGRPQILLSGGYQVSSYDPANGELLWSVTATSRTTCGTMVWNDQMVFASGSYPEPGTFGISLTPNGAKVTWENKVKCYEQSMLVVGDYLYGIADNSIAYCWRCSDGQEMWKHRLSGPFSASPLLIGDRIYASNERGTTFVFKADPTSFQPLAENQLGDSSFASPVYTDQKLLLRHALTSGGKRQEFLAAISID
ncbi:MAG: PQQ-binding-like beta-propeller repeat protein [Pirellulaceae bacterium]|nr:PQQ-binding-like beta-propeller repeat protein [Pirellulaceae bacterium]